MKLGNYIVEGPYTNTALLRELPGVYIILINGLLPVILDVGESESVRSRVINHDRKDCWLRNSHGAWSVAVIYASLLDPDSRFAIEKELRHELNPICGER